MLDDLGVTMVCMKDVDLDSYGDANTSGTTTVMLDLFLGMTGKNMSISFLNDVKRAISDNDRQSV